MSLTLPLSYHQSSAHLNESEHDETIYVRSGAVHRLYSEYNIQIPTLDGDVLAVSLGGRSFSFNIFQSQSRKHLQKSLPIIRDSEEYNELVNKCPPNIPREYGVAEYLSRHLSSEMLGTSVKIAEEADTDAELVLAVAYIQSRTSRLGESDRTLSRYVDQRNKLICNIKSDEDGIHSQFFSQLLLAFALIEDLSDEIIHNHVLREEYRVSGTRDVISKINHSKQYKLLNKSGIIGGAISSAWSNLKTLRNNLVHSINKRDSFYRNRSKDDVLELTKQLDAIVYGLLILSGKLVPEVIRRHGSEEYINKIQSKSVKAVKKAWKEDFPDKFSKIDSNIMIDWTELGWNYDGKKTTSRYDFTGFEQVDYMDEEINNLLTEFVFDCEDVILDRIYGHAIRSNLGRFEFAVAVLLTESSDYSEIGKKVLSEPEFIQRKENVLRWRASTYEKDELGLEIEHPEGSVGPI